MSTREKLLEDLDELKDKIHITDTNVGLIVANDGALISRLRKGTDCNSGTIDKIDALIKFANERLMGTVTE